MSTIFIFKLGNNKVGINQIEPLSKFLTLKCKVPSPKINPIIKSIVGLL